jgi:hypothetical protein
MNYHNYIYFHSNALTHPSSTNMKFMNLIIILFILGVDKKSYYYLSWLVDILKAFAANNLVTFCMLSL